MFNESGKTYIRRLHISTNQSDPLVRQLRLARTFSSLDLQPPGLPASAILCVQKIRAPRQPAQSSYAWEQNVSASLQHLYEHAERPVKKEPAPNAQAILFSDRAELLACLAHDWYTGKLSQHWWWQSLFPNQDHSNLPIQAWLTDPAYVPAALHHLAIRGEATHFVRLLPSPIIPILLENIIRHFALHTLHSIYYPDSISLEDTPAEKNAPPRTQKEPALPFIIDQNLSQAISPSSLPVSDLPPSSPPTSKSPWQPWVPECHEMAPYSNRQLFTGITLMLIRAPHIVRTPAFTHTIQQWQQNASPIQATNATQSSSPTSHKNTYPSNNNAMPAANPSQETTTPQTSAPSPLLTTQNPIPSQSTPLSTLSQQNQESYIYPDTSSSTTQIPLSYNDPNDPSTHLTAINKEKDAIRNSGTAIPEYDALLSKNVEAIPSVNSPLSATTSSFSEKTSRAESSTLETIGTTTINHSTIGISKQEQSDLLQPSLATLTNLSSQYARSEYNNELIPPSLSQAPDAHLPELSSLQTTPTLSQELSSTSTLPFIPALPMTIEGSYETRFGGLFYLVNVALYLELYGDFTAPAQPGLPLTIWDFLALLGHRLTNGKISG